MIVTALVRAVILSILLTSCIEYRFDRFAGRDKYLGWVKTIPKLDPKLGSKGKIYSGISGPTQPYVGGRFSRRRLTINFGVIYYISGTSSLECGLRQRIFQTTDERFGDNTGVINWKDNDDDRMFYFGGRINF